MILQRQIVLDTVKIERRMAKAISVVLLSFLLSTPMLKGDDLLTCPDIFYAWGVNHQSPCSGMNKYTVLDFILYSIDLCPCNFPTINPDYIDPIVGDFYAVTAGTFIQGSDTDPCLGGTESPFTHTLTRDILVMETEVTRQMWADLMGVQPLPVDPTDLLAGSGMNHPVQSIQWPEALLFANLLSAERALIPCYFIDASFLTVLNEANYLDGEYYCNFDAEGYRLPTEGESEYFIRAGTEGPFSIDEPDYHTGNCFDWITTPGTYPNLESVAWLATNINDPVGVNTTKPVGLLNPNPWNLRDVHGNVHEWCFDKSTGSSDYPAGPVTDYVGETGTRRQARGGAWNASASKCRSASRRANDPLHRSGDKGFRLVMTIP